MSLDEYLEQMLPLNMPSGIFGEWDDITLEKWRGKLILAPEDIVGSTFTFNPSKIQGQGSRIQAHFDKLGAGRRYKMIIEGQGGESIIWSFVDAETEEKAGFAYKEARKSREEILADTLESFFSLESKLNNIEFIIYLSDELLKINMLNEIVAYNKGILCLWNGDLITALEAFDLALTINIDIYNLMYHGFTLLKLEQYAEALDDLIVAVNINRTDLIAFLVQMPNFLEAFEQAYKQFDGYYQYNDEVESLFSEVTSNM